MDEEGLKEAILFLRSALLNFQNEDYLRLQRARSHIREAMEILISCLRDSVYQKKIIELLPENGSLELSSLESDLLYIGPFDRITKINLDGEELIAYSKKGEKYYYNYWSDRIWGEVYQSLKNRESKLD